MYHSIITAQHPQFVIVVQNRYCVPVAKHYQFIPSTSSQMSLNTVRWHSAGTAILGFLSHLSPIQGQPNVINNNFNSIEASNSVTIAINKSILPDLQPNSIPA